MQRLYPSDLRDLLNANKHFSGLYLERIRQLSLVDFVFDFSHGQNLFISLNNHTPFLVFNADLKNFPQGGELHSFAINLRRFLGGKLVALEQPNNDMILALIFELRNNILEKEKMTLFIEFIPRHPQAVLVDNNNRILTAYRYHQEREKDGRFIRAGNKYSLPEKGDFDTSKKSTTKDYLNNYLGENADRIKKQNFRDLYVYLETNIKRLKRLIKNFEKDLEKITDLPSLYYNANLLLTYKPAISGYFVQINDENIEVDPRFDALKNAEILFKRAKKIKKSEEILNQKINQTRERINYLESIESHLQNLNDAGEIYQIYEELNLFKRRDKRQVISKLNPYVISHENIDILFGKNNKQNDYLTFKIAKKTDIFMHIKNMPGSHIIIRDESPSKNVLEFAGMLSLFLAKKVDGEVLFTPIYNIKKGVFPGQVIARKFNTIFLRFNDELNPIFESEIKRFYK
ncbi:MAG: hypothetical protein BWY30_00035 [Tenericutes bacterium ADurb.Bin239]|nr:MAG: hypothetical protein BWY30_00035 [Tenericutes bacterium ADurb.Bin239]